MPVPPSTLLAIDRPPQRRGIRKPSLVVMLHGRGADERDLLGLETYLDERCAIVSFRAPYPFDYGGFTWFDLEIETGPDAETLKASSDALLNSVDEAVARLGTDPARTFLFGFSMGTIMAYVAALTHPEKFAGVVAQSGFVLESPSLVFRWNEMSKCPVIATHGLSDPVIPVEMGRRTRDLFVSHGAPIEYYEYDMGHETNGESLRVISAWLTKRLDESERV